MTRFFDHPVYVVTTPTGKHLLQGPSLQTIVKAPVVATTNRLQYPVLQLQTYLSTTKTKM